MAVENPNISLLQRKISRREALIKGSVLISLTSGLGSLADLVVTAKQRIDTINQALPFSESTLDTAFKTRGEFDQYAIQQAQTAVAEGSNTVIIDENQAQSFIKAQDVITQYEDTKEKLGFDKIAGKTDRTFGLLGIAIASFGIAVGSNLSSERLKNELFLLKISS